MMMGELLFFLLLDFVQPFRPHYGWQGSFRTDRGMNSERRE